MVGIIERFRHECLLPPYQGNVQGLGFTVQGLGFSVSHVEEAKKELMKDVHRLDRLGFRLKDSQNGDFMVHNTFDSYLVVQVQSKQHLDPKLRDLKKSILRKCNEVGVLRYQGKLCVPDVDDLRKKVLGKYHGS